MESSSAPRVRVACDSCGAGAWIGPRPGGGADAWCEACQRPQLLAEGAEARCPVCGGALTTGAPRFAELWGRFQHLDAVLAAWNGDPAPLATLLPERPRFLTDLTPPEPGAGDAPALAAALAAAGRGEWAAVLAGPAGGEPRGHAARAIASERLGDAAGAIAEWTRALEPGEWEQARLARGALHAKAGEWTAAAADFAKAGDGREARWNRASARVHRAVASTPGLPDPRSIDAARMEAGKASDFWSDATVGRLAFGLLAERAIARREAREFGDLDLVSLREGEDLLEHATFWDRALVLVAHAKLGAEAGGDARRVARPLARELAAGLLAEPPMRGAALAEARAAVEAAWDTIAAFEPLAARAALAPWLANGVLRRYRLPCAACGRGGVGAEAWDEAATEASGGPAGDAKPAAFPGGGVPPV